MRKSLAYVVVLVLVAVGIVPALAQEPRSHAHVLGACQDLIRKSVREFANDLHHHAGHCALHGLACLLGARSVDSCCVRAARRCADDLRKMTEAERRFTIRMAHRTCSRVAFDDIVSTSGLDFGAAIAECRCLQPPIAVVDLDTLTACVLRVTARDTIDLIAAAEVPRVREALTCMGLDDDFPGVTEQPSTDCGASPTPSASSGATPSASVAPSPSATAAVATVTAGSTPTTATTATPTAGSTPSAATTATPTATLTVTVAASTTPTNTASTAQLTPTVLASTTPTPQASAPPGATPFATVTSSPTPTVTLTPAAIVTPVTTPSRTATPSPAPTIVPVCGNGVVEGNEQCDGTAVDNTTCFEDICTCEDFCDDAGGTLACNPDCTLNFSGCTAGGCSF